MKHPTLAFAAAALLAASCSSLPPVTVDVHAIQPWSRFDPAALPAPGGVLHVITDTYESAWDESSTYSVHRGYDVYDDHGRFVQRVENHRSPTDEGVMDVRLSAGTYLVAYPDGNRPRFWIEVKIEDGRLTTADVTTLRAPR